MVWLLVFDLEWIVIGLGWIWERKLNCFDFKGTQTSKEPTGGRCSCEVAFRGASCENLKCPGAPECSNHGSCQVTFILPLFCFVLFCCFVALLLCFVLSVSLNHPPNTHRIQRIVWFSFVQRKRILMGFVFANRNGEGVIVPFEDARVCVLFCFVSFLSFSFVVLFWLMILFVFVVVVVVLFR